MVVNFSEGELRKHVVLTPGISGDRGDAIEIIKECLGSGLLDLSVLAGTGKPRRNLVKFAFDLVDDINAEAEARAAR